MKMDNIKHSAFSMPLTSPSYPRGPYRFVNREFLIITYETDMDVLREVVPEPLNVVDPIVKFEFIRMPDSTGFGDYTESGQVIPVDFEGVTGGYTHAMYLNDFAPISGGREIWGFPKKLAEPCLKVDKDTLLGTLYYGDECVAVATMGYKHGLTDEKQVLASLLAPSVLLKMIPHVDGSLRICELVRYSLSDINIKGAWTGPGGLELFHHALAPVAQLPVRSVVSALHILTDLTLPYGEVVHDYLA